MAEDPRLILHFKTKAKFEQKLNDPNDDTINPNKHFVVIHDSQQFWVRGQYIDGKASTINKLYDSWEVIQDNAETLTIILKGKRWNDTTREWESVESDPFTINTATEEIAGLMSAQDAKDVRTNLPKAINDESSRARDQEAAIRNRIVKLITEQSSSTIDDALQVLKNIGDNEDYSTVEKIATKLRDFLEGTLNKDNTIENWKEIESFLQGITDTQTLTGIIKDAIKDAINALDSEKTSTDGKNVQVKVVETDGKISGVNITTDNTASTTDLNNHINNKSNPHEVTKAQVGLGNVDNTSDASKPISTATQNALNDKAGTRKIWGQNLTSSKNDITGNLTNVGNITSDNRLFSLTPARNDNGEQGVVYVHGDLAIGHVLTIGPTSDYTNSSLLTLNGTQTNYIWTNPNVSDGCLYIGVNDKLDGKESFNRRAASICIDPNRNVGIQWEKADSAPYPLSVNGYTYATGYKTPDGTSTQFLKADGSVDNTLYLSTTGGMIASNESNEAIIIQPDSILVMDSFNNTSITSDTIYIRDKSNNHVHITPTKIATQNSEVIIDDILTKNNLSDGLVSTPGDTRVCIGSVSKDMWDAAMSPNGKSLSRWIYTIQNIMSHLECKVLPAVEKASLEIKFITTDDQDVDIWVNGSHMLVKDLKTIFNNINIEEFNPYKITLCRSLLNGISVYYCTNLFIGNDGRILNFTFENLSVSIDTSTERINLNISG